jgi:hypothetical protein
MENKFYVYVYLDTRKPGNYTYEDLNLAYEPFYVGKGSGNRMMVHMQEKFLKKNSPKNQKIKKILASGKRPEIVKIFDFLSEELAFQKEIRLIELIGRKDKGTGPLNNLYDGGYGSSKTEETRKKISETKKRMFQDGEIAHPMLGKEHSQESKTKMSLAHKGKKLSPDHIETLKVVRRKVKCHFTKDWTVVSPYGVSQVVHGLGEFCRDNNLSQPHMFSVAKGLRSHHKGWKCYESNCLP